MNISSNWRRFVLMGLAGISLLTGLWAGIARMGWFLPVPNGQFVLVHGPLMATLLAGLAGRQFVGREAGAFSFRALKPVFDLHPFEACGRPDGADAAELWIRDHAGHKAMAARMEFRP